MTDEYRALLKDNIHIRYYCPRCGRTLDLDAEKDTATVKGAGEYTGLIDRYAGTCSPHRWEYASSTSVHDVRIETRTTNELGEVTVSVSGPILGSGDGHWQFKGFARGAGNTPDFISAIKTLAETDPDLCRKIMIWFSGCPPLSDDYEAYINSWFDDEEMKIEAAQSFKAIMVNHDAKELPPELDSWLTKYIYEETPQPAGPEYPPQSVGPSDP